jgi:surfeit locus 1 family protein
MHWSLMLRRLIVLLAALAGALGTARLGLWQLDRAAQKTALFQARQQQASLPILTQVQLARLPAELDAQLYRRVQLEGRWLDSYTVFLENRQMNGAPGYYVVTPLLLDDGDAVVVQRGWLPRDPQDRTRLPPFTTSAGKVRIEGHIAPDIARLYEFEAAASGPIRQNLDLASYASQVGRHLRPLVVVQVQGGRVAADGLRRQWLPAVLDVSKHHGYAFQWFALSALIAGLYVWFQLLRRRRSDKT